MKLQEKMLLDDLKKIKKLRTERLKPALSFTSFGLKELCQKVRAKWFPGIDRMLEVFFVNQDVLACIMIDKDRDVSEIYIHNILNHTGTPIEVFEFIFKHELIHLVIPPREVKGKMKDHPPEFWVMEKEIAPERNDAWLWIWNNFWWVLKSRPRLEQTDVMRSWKRHISGPVCTIEECRAERMKYEVLEMAGGSTL